MFKSKIPKNVFRKNIKTKEDKLKLEDKLSIENINLKKQEIRLKSEEADLKKLNVLEKSFELDVWDKNKKSDNDYINLNKVIVLKGVLESCIVDENTSFGSDMKWKSSFENDEIGTIKNKLFELINKM